MVEEVESVMPDYREQAAAMLAGYDGPSCTPEGWHPHGTPVGLVASLLEARDKREEEIAAVVSQIKKEAAKIPAFFTGTAVKGEAERVTALAQSLLPKPTTPDPLAEAMRAAYGAAAPEFVAAAYAELDKLGKCISDKPKEHQS